MDQITERAHGIDTYVDEYKRDGNGKLIVPKLASLNGQIDFVIAQIYQGGYWTDFPIVWDNLCSPCGIRGVYVYQVSGDSWIKQAEEVLVHTPTDCQCIVLDVEKTGNTGDKTMLADSGRILRYWEKNKSHPMRIFYYVNIDIYINYILPIMSKYYPADKWYLDFDLWVSQWPWLKTLRSPDNNPSLPRNMRGDWKIHQYTDAGDKLLYSAADLDVFNGPVSDMRAWLGLDVETPPAPPEPPISVPSITTAVVTAERGLNVHVDRDLSSAIVGGLLAGSSVPVEVSGDMAELHGFVATQFLSFPPVDQLPEPESEPTPEPSSSDVVDDLQYCIIKHKPRDAIPGKYAPDTCPLQDHPVPDRRKGAAILVMPLAWDYMRKINDDQGYKYCRSVNAMWINTAYDQEDPDAVAHAESISCGGNFLSYKKGDVENDCIKLQCFPNNQDFSIFDPQTVNWFTRPDLFFKAIAINADGDLINVRDGVDCFIPLMARTTNNGTGELWLGLDYVELFPELPVTITVLPDDPDHKLNIRESPGIAGEDIGDYASGEQITILQYKPLGASVWGRTRDGWICLLLAGRPGQRQFLTSWKLNTVGVIPPE